jgi:hypothetical protein
MTESTFSVAIALDDDSRPRRNTGQVIFAEDYLPILDIRIES